MKGGQEVASPTNEVNSLYMQNSYKSRIITQTQERSVIFPVDFNIVNFQRTVPVNGGFYLINQMFAS